MMTPADWQRRFMEVSAELVHLVDNDARPGDEVTEREGKLLEELDDLELRAAAMVRAGTA
jgi:hypothetical protein